MKSEDKQTLYAIAAEMEAGADAIRRSGTRDAYKLMNATKLMGFRNSILEICAREEDADSRRTPADLERESPEFQKMLKQTDDAQPRRRRIIQVLDKDTIR